MRLFLANWIPVWFGLIVSEKHFFGLLLLLAACGYLVLLQNVLRTADPKKGCNTSTGTELGNQDLRLGPSCILVLRNALEVAVEEKWVALEMVLHLEDDHLQK